MNLPTWGLMRFDRCEERGLEIKGDRNTFAHVFGHKQDFQLEVASCS